MNIFNNYFTEQSSLDDTYASLPTELHLPDYILDSITLTSYAVEPTLSSLQLGKATGPDVNNNIILKELKDVLLAPLCVLYNASLYSGPSSKHMKGSKRHSNS